MILFWMIAILVTAGAAAWIGERKSQTWPRVLSLIGLGLDALLLVGSKGASLSWNWIPQWGVRFNLKMDGLSFLLVALTLFLGIAAVLASFTGIKKKVGLFHLNLMLVLAGIVGVFVSYDLFLFYFFWELMLVPMYFLIAIWGYERRTRAAFKFFIFTQASGLLMLLSILALYFVHGRSTGTYTFDYFELLNTNMSHSLEMWLMLGFFVAFAVKLPVIPFHTWLPDAHTEAPTAGSVILAGLLLKTGGYGLIRFVLPFFPRASIEFAPVAYALAVGGILYGGVLAFAQTDLKRLVAYTSVSHLGFVLLGVFLGNELGLQGAVIQMICHGISTGALFILVGAIQERTHTREITRLGGLWDETPRMGAVGLFFALGSMGLPGLGNFVGEFLTLMGAYRVSVLVCALAALGFVVSTLYSLWLVQAVFHGPKPQGLRLPDLSGREMTIMVGLMVSLTWIGLYARPVLNAATPVVENVLAGLERTHARR